MWSFCWCFDMFWHVLSRPMKIAHGMMPWLGIPHTLGFHRNPIRNPYRFLTPVRALTLRQIGLWDVYIESPMIGNQTFSPLYLNLPPNKNEHAKNHDLVSQGEIYKWWVKLVIYVDSHGFSHVPSEMWRLFRLLTHSHYLTSVHTGDAASSKCHRREAWDELVRSASCSKASWKHCFK